MTGRIPPAGEDLWFVRSGTGTVHIHPHIPKYYEDDYEAEVEVIPVGEWHLALLAVVLGPGSPMLCGMRVKFGYPGAPGDWTGVFDDDDLCTRCVRALGDQSVRAFEHERPGDAELEEADSA